jgi:hypothetical protein
MSGKQGSFIYLCGKEIRVEGTLVRTARVAEGYDTVQDPHQIISALRDAGVRVDLFTFMQHLSDPVPKHDFFMEWDNYAAMPVGSFDEWFTQKVDSKIRNKLRKAEKVGVQVREVPFDDALVAGIAAINNECPIRQGRRFPHYGDSLDTVRRKNGSFAERAVFIGVFFEDALIGYAKLVTDEAAGQAGLMQILSMLKYRDKAPNNLLIAQAVRSCAQRNIPYLWYANFSYGKKERDSLSDFKKENGFERVDLPRYYMPCSMLGRIALQVRLHHGFKEYIPWALLKHVRRVRNSWYSRLTERDKQRA